MYAVTVKNYISHWSVRQICDTFSYKRIHCITVVIKYDIKKGYNEIKTHLCFLSEIQQTYFMSKVLGIKEISWINLLTCFKDFVEGFHVLVADSSVEGSERKKNRN